MDDKKKKILSQADVDAGKYGNIVKDFTVNKINTNEVLPQITGMEKALKDDAISIENKLKKVGSYAPAEALDKGKEISSVARKLLSEGKEEAAKSLLSRARGAMLKNAANWGMKALPGLGAITGIATALSTGDASAALPLGFEATSSGPEQGSPQAVLEDMSASEEERAIAAKQLRDKYKTQY